jgi:hypothetical protein
MKAGDRRACDLARQGTPPLPPVRVPQVREHGRFLQGYNLLAVFPPSKPASTPVAGKKA